MHRQYIHQWMELLAGRLEPGERVLARGRAFALDGALGLDLSTVIGGPGSAVLAFSRRDTRAAAAIRKRLEAAGVPARENFTTWTGEPPRNRSSSRFTLVPASMKLLGDRNWYLPRWLSWRAWPTRPGSRTTRYEVAHARAQDLATWEEPRT